MINQDDLLKMGGLQLNKEDRIFDVKLGVEATTTTYLSTRAKLFTQPPVKQQDLPKVFTPSYTCKDIQWTPSSRQ